MDFLSFLAAARLHGAGIVFSVDDLAVTEAVLAANGVSSAEAGGRLVVSAAPVRAVHSPSRKNDERYEQSQSHRRRRRQFGFLFQ